MLTAWTMTSLVGESGTRVESSAINLQLTFVFHGVLRGAALILADFTLVVGVVHCWAWRLGGQRPEVVTSAKVFLIAFWGGGGRVGTGGAERCGIAAGQSEMATSGASGCVARAASSSVLGGAQWLCRNATAAVRSVTWLAKEVTKYIGEGDGAKMNASESSICWSLSGGGGEVLSFCRLMEEEE